MNPKFILTIVTFSTLSLVGSIAVVSSVKAENNVPQFSQTISKLVDLDLKYHALVTSAIGRAIANRKIISSKNKGVDMPNRTLTLGNIAAPKIDRTPTGKTNET
jgi:hypothetical protein